jgi:DNA-binding response OmpR family regulator
MISREINPLEILLVDDDLDILSLFKERLELQGFLVKTATDGLLALSYLEKHQVDCLVTDLSMPGMDGVELVRKLREKGNVTPLFFITGYLDYPRESLNRFGPKAIIFKPFDFEEAAILIKNHLQKSS